MSQANTVHSTAHHAISTNSASTIMNNTNHLLNANNHADYTLNTNHATNTDNMGVLGKHSSTSNSGDTIADRANRSSTILSNEPKLKKMKLDKNSSLSDRMKVVSTYKEFIRVLDTYEMYGEKELNYLLANTNTTSSSTTNTSSTSDTSNIDMNLTQYISNPSFRLIPPFSVIHQQTDTEGESTTTEFDTPYNIEYTHSNSNNLSDENSMSNSILSRSLTDPFSYNNSNQTTSGTLLDRLGSSFDSAISDTYSNADNTADSNNNIYALSLEQLEQRRLELSDKIKQFQLDSGKLLKFGVEPPRTKSHWDYLLQEAVWMSGDFQREKLWKKRIAKQIAVEIKQYFIKKNRKKEENSGGETVKPERDTNIDSTASDSNSNSKGNSSNSIIVNVESVDNNIMSDSDQIPHLESALNYESSTSSNSSLSIPTINTSTGSSILSAYEENEGLFYDIAAHPPYESTELEIAQTTQQLQYYSAYYNQWLPELLSPHTTNPSDNSHFKSIQSVFSLKDSLYHEFKNVELVQKYFCAEWEQKGYIFDSDQLKSLEPFNDTNAIEDEYVYNEEKYMHSEGDYGLFSTEEAQMKMLGLKPDKALAAFVSNQHRAYSQKQYQIRRIAKQIESDLSFMSEINANMELANDSRNTVTIEKDNAGEPFVIRIPKKLLPNYTPYNKKVVDTNTTTAMTDNDNNSTTATASSRVPVSSLISSLDPSSRHSLESLEHKKLQSSKGKQGLFSVYSNGVVNNVNGRLNHSLILQQLNQRMLTTPRAQLAEELREKVAWTQEEDRILIHTVNEYGSNWLLVQLILQSNPRVTGRLRSTKEIQARYAFLQQRKAEKAQGNKFTDEMLFAIVSNNDNSGNILPPVDMNSASMNSNVNVMGMPNVGGMSMNMGIHNVPIMPTSVSVSPLPPQPTTEKEKKKEKNKEKKEKGKDKEKDKEKDKNKERKEEESESSTFLPFFPIMKNSHENFTMDKKSQKSQKEKKLSKKEKAALKDKEDKEKKDKSSSSTLPPNTVLPSNSMPVLPPKRPLSSFVPGGFGSKSIYSAIDRAMKASKAEQNHAKSALRHQFQLPPNIADTDPNNPNKGMMPMGQSLHCFPPDHEILTKSGFMSYYQFQEHFNTNKTIELACYNEKNKSIEYHPIEEEYLIVRNTDHNELDMVAISTAPSSSTRSTPVDLLVTANHNLYVNIRRSYWHNKLLGRLVKGDRAGQRDEYGIIQAGSVATKAEDQFNNPMECGTDSEYCKGDFMAASFLCHAPNGYHPSDHSWRDLPFVSLLGVASRIEVDSFIQLYGYWIGNGSLDSHTKSLTFAPIKGAHSEYYLDNLFGRLSSLDRFDAPISGQRATQAGYYKHKSIGAVEYHLRHDGWWQLFAYEYGHKYYGYNCLVAALKGALARGSGVPRGSYFEAIQENDVETALREIIECGAAGFKKRFGRAMERPASSASSATIAYSGIIRRIGCGEYMDADEYDEYQFDEDDSENADELDEMIRRIRGVHPSPQPPAVHDISTDKWLMEWSQFQLNKEQSALLIQGLKCTHANNNSNHLSTGKGECVNVISTSSPHLLQQLFQTILHAGYACHSLSYRSTGVLKRHEWTLEYTDESDGATPWVGAWQSPPAREHNKAMGYPAVEIGISKHDPVLPYRDIVWCVTVPDAVKESMGHQKSGLIIARRPLRQLGEQTNQPAVHWSRPTIIGNSHPHQQQTMVALHQSHKYAMIEAHQRMGLPTTAMGKTLMPHQIIQLRLRRQNIVNVSTQQAQHGVAQQGMPPADAAYHRKPDNMPPQQQYYQPQQMHQQPMHNNNPNYPRQPQQMPNANVPMNTAQPNQQQQQPMQYNPNMPPQQGQVGQKHPTNMMPNPNNNNIQRPQQQNVPINMNNNTINPSTSQSPMAMNSMQQQQPRPNSAMSHNSINTAQPPNTMNNAQFAPNANNANINPQTQRMPPQGYVQTPTPNTSYPPNAPINSQQQTTAPTQQPNTANPLPGSPMGTRSRQIGRGSIPNNSANMNTNSTNNNFPQQQQQQIPYNNNQSMYQQQQQRPPYPQQQQPMNQGNASSTQSQSPLPSNPSSSSPPPKTADEWVKGVIQNFPQYKKDILEIFNRENLDPQTKMNTVAKFINDAKARMMPNTNTPNNTAPSN